MNTHLEENFENEEYKPLEINENSKMTKSKTDEITIDNSTLTECENIFDDSLIEIEVKDSIKKRKRDKNKNTHSKSKDKITKIKLENTTKKKKSKTKKTVIEEIESDDDHNFGLAMRIWQNIQELPWKEIDPLTVSDSPISKSSLNTASVLYLLSETYFSRVSVFSDISNAFERISSFYDKENQKLIRRILKSISPEQSKYKYISINSPKCSNLEFNLLADNPKGCPRKKTNLKSENLETEFKTEINVLNLRNSIYKSIFENSDNGTINDDSILDECLNKDPVVNTDIQNIFFEKLKLRFEGDLKDHSKVACLNAIRHLETTDLVNFLNSKLVSVLSKKETLINNLKNRIKNSISDQSMFYRNPLLINKESLELPLFFNTIKEKSVLYSVKSSFPIESIYLKLVEERNRLNNNKNLDPNPLIDFSINKPFLRNEDILCQVCNSGDDTSNNLIIFCTVILLVLQCVCSSNVLWN